MMTEMKRPRERAKKTDIEIPWIETQGKNGTTDREWIEWS